MTDLDIKNKNKVLIDYLRSFINDFVIRAEFCFDKDGNPIEENIKILNEIDNRRKIVYDKGSVFLLIFMAFFAMMMAFISTVLDTYRC